MECSYEDIVWGKISNWNCQNGYEELSVNPTEVQRTVLRESRKKDCKALFYIQQGVDASYFEKISKITKAKEA